MWPRIRNRKAQTKKENNDCQPQSGDLLKLLQCCDMAARIGDNIEYRPPKTRSRHWTSHALVRNGLAAERDVN